MVCGVGGGWGLRVRGGGGGRADCLSRSTEEPPSNLAPRHQNNCRAVS